MNPANGIIKNGKKSDLTKKSFSGFKFRFLSFSLSLSNSLSYFSPFLSTYGYCFRFICSVPFSCAIFLSLFLHFFPFSSFLCCSHSFHLSFSPSYLSPFLSLSLPISLSILALLSLSYLVSLFLSITHVLSLTFSLSPFLYLSVEQWPQ